MTSAIARLIALFDSRLVTLDALLATAVKQQGEEKTTALLGARLAPDMFPLVRQISIAGNLARQLTQWCAGEDISTTDSDIATLAEAHAHIAQVRQLLVAVKADDSQLDKVKEMKLPGDMRFNLSGRDYADEWLLPNFYFHLVTAYNILRANGVEIGKRDYMAHLMPTIMQQMAAAQGA